MRYTMDQVRVANRLRLAAEAVHAGNTEQALFDLEVALHGLRAGGTRRVSEGPADGTPLLRSTPAGWVAARHSVLVEAP